MRRNQLYKILLICTISNLVLLGQINTRENHPLSKNFLLTLEFGPNYGFTDYEKSNIGISLFGGLEYYLSTQNKSVFGFKLNVGQQFVSGEKNYLGLPNTFSTDIRSAGLGIIYSYSASKILNPFISIGGSYYWYAFESKEIRSLFYDYTNGGKENSIVYDIEPGIKFNISKSIGIMASLGYHYIADDNIDAIKIGDYQDFILTAKLGLTINIFAEDEDSDLDGIIDEKDACPDQPEDFDGFQDEDGCPDLDNDGDGIKDNDDLCPNLKEDIDGFQDEDGCPDEDNDGDGIKDVDDQCPNKKEDFDGFQDEDGCPDIDNDEDGILDSIDGCPNVAETFNGYMDEDGCPDELPKPIYIEKDPVKDPVSKPKVESKPKDTSPDAPNMFILQSEATFGSNSDQIKITAHSRLNEVAEQLNKYPQAKWRIEAHIDKQNSAIEAVTITRQQANAILNYFVTRGVSGANLQAYGAGDSSPISSNSSVYGKMKNRRIIIKRIF